MINYDNLIHNRAYFELSHIEERKSRYNFTQTVKVETFLWDLEMYAQLQRTLGDLVALKGGAAAQLFFPPERQRTSVDIDVIYTGNEETLSKALATIHQTLGGDEVFFKFNKYTPSSPKTNLPLETYFVSVPTVTGGKTPINIKVDFHMMRDLVLRTVALEKANAFVFPLAFNPRCLSAGTLIGDKLLTLAQGSVGIPREREDDIPKQLYDLDGLTRVVADEEFEALQTAMEVLFDRELSVRSEKVSMAKAIEQMSDLLERYSSLDSHKSDERAQSAIRNFRGNYEPKPFKNPVTWGIVSKRLQVLVKSISEGVGNSLSVLRRADEIERIIALKDDDKRVEFREVMRKEFVKILRAEGREKIAKRLRNTIPERLLWEVLTPSNLEKVRAGILEKKKR